ncbi:MAG: hypothetical protein CMJ87_09705 [Planctomycetes bacterium]|nr:hypothetical protein [Planctomycetota bacterium]
MVARLPGRDLQLIIPGGVPGSILGSVLGGVNRRWEIHSTIPCFPPSPCFRFSGLARHLSGGHLLTSNALLGGFLPRAGSPSIRRTVGIPEDSRNRPRPIQPGLRLDFLRTRYSRELKLWRRSWPSGGNLDGPRTGGGEDKQEVEPHGFWRGAAAPY